MGKDVRFVRSINRHFHLFHFRYVVGVEREICLLDFPRDLDNERSWKRGTVVANACRLRLF